MLIRVGSQDIAFSPAFTFVLRFSFSTSQTDSISFRMFSSTRDPPVDFPADLVSRVTMVNFSVSRDSSIPGIEVDFVSADCSSKFASSVSGPRPPSGTIAGDPTYYASKENSQLNFISSSQVCSRLSANLQGTSSMTTSESYALSLKCRSDSLRRSIGTLETLKREAAEDTRKVEEIDSVMAEVEQVTREYLPLAQACSSICSSLSIRVPPILPRHLRLRPPSQSLPHRRHRFPRTTLHPRQRPVPPRL